MPTGPIEMLAVKFPGNRFTGEIAPALADLVESDTIRLIDILFVRKDADGLVEVTEISEFDDRDVRRVRPCHIRHGRPDERRRRPAHI